MKRKNESFIDRDLIISTHIVRERERKSYARKREREREFKRMRDRVFEMQTKRNS